ncbi:DUF6259 domain-containing protein [uncultured Victivallis sp.]|uniref:DUF6259 domain-containing protein n=1 Tax=uncultured Victivallis sp. TaxID=354118 RepID=UPI0025ECB5A7|nr:DUF6259 domain-containing protein [uncultured Victivallis sp.]
MNQLGNEFVSLSIDETGALTELCNRKSGRNLVCPHSLVRLILGDSGCLELEAVPAGVPDIRCGEDRITLVFSEVECKDRGTIPISVSLLAELDGDEIRWSVALENHSREQEVREVHYPIFAIRDPAPPMAAISSEQVSERIENLPEQIRKCFSWYMAPDQKYIRRMTLYPGRTSSMNCFALDWGNEGLYYGCHDSSFLLTGQMFELERQSSINMFMVRYPFLKAGGSWRECNIVTAPYSGNWTTCAARYRKWADEWFTPPQIPEHVAHSSGWQRIILHHQYGEYLFPYEKLEQAYDDAAKAGIDTLFLFGWTAEGMDSGYPVYSADSKLGGVKALKENIRKVQAKGGKVILYFNGQLIDVESDYYRSGEGARVAIKRAEGTEHREYYNFTDGGTFLRAFINKTFVVACPACRSWLEILKRHVDFAVELGVDSVFFDQLGMLSYPCCDPTHGHPVPYTGLMNGKREMLKKLYEYAKSRNPTMGFGIECTTDQTLQYTDFVHIVGYPANVWNPDWREKKEKPQTLSATYLFKAAFPEAVISNRNIRDDSDVEFPVNQMLLLGSRSDVEIYRCRATIAETPHYQAYLAKANALRERFGRLLYEGKFSAETFHSVSNTEVQTNSFLLGDELAVLLTQSNRELLRTEVAAPGFQLVRMDSVSGDVTMENGVVALPRNGFAVLLYRREEVTP